MDIETTCCFTGHRFINKAHIARLATLLDAAVRRMVEYGYTDFLTGGAIGFDTMAAETLVALREELPVIRYHLIIPALEQSKKWSENNKVKYEWLKEIADSCTLISEEYTKSCLLERNRFLVDNSSACICYLKSNRGGTAHTVRYALKKELTVVNLNDVLTAEGNRSADTESNFQSVPD